VRDYLFQHKKITNWPPAAGGAYSGSDVFPAPLEGTLHSARMVQAFDDQPEFLKGTREVRGRLWAGEVYAADPEDHAALPKLCAELQELIGQQIASISNMEFYL